MYDSATLVVPPELLDYDQWVLWKYEVRDGKVTKVPYATDGKRASSTSPATWTDCDSALSCVLSGNAAGVGFVFTAKDPFVGIDWDHVVDNGDIPQGVMDEVASFNSYAELSPSKHGIHCICKGKIPSGSRCRSGGKEIYSKGRFFTFTGDWISSTPNRVLEAPSGVIEAFVKALTPNKPEVIAGVSLPYKSQPTSKEEVREIYLKCQQVAHFSKLFSGDISGYNSHSEADFALCYIIARNTQNPSVVDIIFRTSKLYRDKWNNNDYYRKRTLNSAMTAALASSIEDMISDDS